MKEALLGDMPYNTPWMQMMNLQKQMQRQTIQHDKKKKEWKHGVE